MPESIGFRLTGTALYLAIVAAVLAAYSKPIFSLATGGWIHTNGLSHGYLLLVVAAMELARRLRLAVWQTRPTTHWPLLVLGSLSMCWLLAERLDIQTLTQGLVPLVVAAATIAYVGWQQRRLAVPWLLMLFAVPGWSWLGPILQALAISVVSVFVKLVGIPAYIQAPYFQLPYGTLEIADGCSGVHQFTIGLLLSVLFCVNAELPPRRAAWIIACGAAASLIANWVRIAVLVVVAHESQMQHRWVTVDHYWMGWSVFALVFGSYLVIVARYVKSPPPVEELRAGSSSPESPRSVNARALRVALVAAVGPILSALM